MRFLSHPVMGLVLLGLVAAACSSESASENANAPPTNASPNSDVGDGGGPITPVADGSAATQGPGLIVTYHQRSRDVASAVLKEGGTAADAFVAATLIEYVLQPDVTSIAGPVGMLSYHPDNGGSVKFVDGSFDAVHDPAGLYDEKNPKLGASVLIPGAMRGLELLWKTDGKLPWSRLVTPAADLAEQGFTVDQLLAATIASASDALHHSAYGKSKFFPGDHPLAEGQQLVQPELGALLRDVAANGAKVFYEGKYAAEFVSVVNGAGGKAQASDLSGYQAALRDPWSIERPDGRKVFACSGRTQGGVYGLMGIQALANDPRTPATMSEADRLEARLRVGRALYDDGWFYDASKLDDAAFVKERLTANAGTNLWSHAWAGHTQPSFAKKGTHSFHLTVMDSKGNAVTGTHTLNAMPFGTGLFVAGIALGNAGAVRQLVPAAGERVVSPFALHAITTKEGKLSYIGGSFGTSLLETAYQTLEDAIEGVSAKDSSTRHRFGTFAYATGDGEQDDFNANWLAPETPDDVTNELTKRGLFVKRDPMGDTGFGTFITREADGMHGGGFSYPWIGADTAVVP